MIYLLVLYNIFRIVVLKMRRKKLVASLIQRVSPSANLKIFGHGKLTFGRNLDIAPTCDIQVHNSGELEIGEATYMNRGCIVSCQGKISIGKRCMFGPGVKIFDNNHKFSRDKGVSCDLNIGTISIGNNCWIASDVIILKGAKVGNNCVIGAGCIIDFEIPDNSLVKQHQTIDVLPIYK